VEVDDGRSSDDSNEDMEHGEINEKIADTGDQGTASTNADKD
jgi:hypothetical protein